MDAAQREWKRAEAESMERFKADGFDYRTKPALLAAYNTHLKALGQDEKNANRDAAWFLSEAHRLVRADLGLPATTPTQRAGKNNNPGVDMSEIPPTLRSTPAAGTGAVNADEFAHLRTLEGLELEKAVANLTERQRDRWLDAA